MDIDAYVATHSGEWARLQQLVRRRRSLTGAEADELVDLYQRTATHLSVVRSASPDPALVGRLSSLVAQARSAVAGTRSPSWKDAVRVLTVSFPAAVYRARRWWVPIALVSTAVAFVLGAWVAANPSVQASIGTPAEIRQLVEEDFESYYSSSPAGSFAARVWTNNAWIAAGCLVLGGIPFLIGPAIIVFILWMNIANVGVIGGIMAANDRLGLFFGLISPHGLLELTAVFVAAGAGMRLGWTFVDPGPRSRSQAMAEEGRTVGIIAVGLVVVLAISGVIEAYVTPSGLPTFARVAIGVVALGGFLAYVWVLGGRAVRQGHTGDVEGATATDVLPVAG